MNFFEFFLVGAACQDLQRSRDTPVSVSVLFNDRSVVAPVQKEERVFFVVRVLVRHSLGEGVVKPSAEVKRRLGGEKWLEWLDRQGVGYVVRVKQNILINGKAAFRQVITEKGKKKNAESSSTGSASQFMTQFLSCSVNPSIF